MTTIPWSHIRFWLHFNFNLLSIPHIIPDTEESEQNKTIWKNILQHCPATREFQIDICLSWTMPKS